MDSGSLTIVLVSRKIPNGNEFFANTGNTACDGFITIRSFDSDSLESSTRTILFVLDACYFHSKITLNDF